VAPCESMSAPLAAGVLTRGSFMGQCQLLHQRCVTHLLASLERVAQCLPNKCSHSNYWGVGFCSTLSQPQTFQGVRQYSVTWIVTLLVVPL